MTATPARRLMALDCASLYYRAFYGVPESITAPDGTPANAIRGFLEMIARLVRDHRPAALAPAWDADWRPDFRVERVPSYKAHRVAEVVEDGEDVEEAPDGLAPQVDAIAEFLVALGIPPLAAAGFEADDVLGTVAHRLGDSALPFDSLDIVTGDRDLFQLVDDSRGIRVLYTARGVSQVDAIIEEVVADRYGIPARSYAAYAALRGDTSDGLPGVPGIGEKTAAAIVGRHPTLDSIRAAMDDEASGLSAPVRARLQAARDYLAVIDPVVLVATDCAIDLSPLTGPLHIDDAALDRLTQRWGLRSSVDRVRTALLSMAV